MQSDGRSCDISKVAPRSRFTVRAKETAINRKFFTCSLATSVTLRHRLWKVHPVGLLFDEARQAEPLGRDRTATGTSRSRRPGTILAWFVLSYRWLEAQARGAPLSRCWLGGRCKRAAVTPFSALSTTAYANIHSKTNIIPTFLIVT